MRYGFGEYVLDTDRYELRRQGTPVSLAPQAFKLLTYLLEHRDRMVTKEELHEQVWQSKYVADAALTTCIAAVRQALEDRGHQCIKTVHRRGYRFTAPVREQQGEAADVAAPVFPDTPKPVERSAIGGGDALAERRHLTILVCRILDAAADAASQEPDETLLDVLSDFQTMCETAVRQFEGYIARYAGDQLVVYFGYPQGHEDDARRAVYTGLALLAGMAALNVRCKRDVGMRLAVRVGIHTGAVVMRGNLHEPLTLGGTPTTAIRLQDLAGPDTVLISEATRRLVEQDFLCEPLGAHVLEGLSQPLAVYRILQERPVPSPGEPVVPRGLRPFVGREQQLGLLLECWAQVQDGRGQVVLLSGEAGIGKSRLVQALQEGMADETYTRIAWALSPYYQHSAWYPVIASLHQLLQWRRKTPRKNSGNAGTGAGAYWPVSARARSAVCRPALSAAGKPLSSPQPHATATTAADTGRCAGVAAQGDRTAARLSGGRGSPLGGSLYPGIPGPPDRPHPRGPPPAVITLSAGFSAAVAHAPPPDPDGPGPFEPQQVERMVAQMVGNIPLPPEVLQYIVAKTDGVPLFVEELTKMVLESGLVKELEGRYVLVAPLPALAIPMTLHDSLMARLDRLGAAKEVAQLGATIGREFSYS